MKKERLHPPIYRMPHCKEAGQTTQRVGNGFGQKNTGFAKAQGREQQRQWNNDHGLPEQGEEDSLFCFSQRLKDALT